MIDDIDQRCQRCGFTGTGGTGYQHKAGAHFTKLLNLLGHIKLFHGENFGRNQTEHAAVTTLLFKEVTTEARLGIHFISKVGIAAVGIFLPQTRRANRLHEFNHILMRKYRLFNGHNITVHSHFRRLSFRKVQV